MAYVVMASGNGRRALLIFGLFTRFFAAALAIELLIAFCSATCRKAFAAGNGGYEYVLLIGIVLFTIAMRGGGPYSVDAKLGKELYEQIRAAACAYIRRAPTLCCRGRQRRHRAR